MCKKLMVCCLYIICCAVQVQADDMGQVLGFPVPFNDEFNQEIDLLNDNTSDWSVLGAGSMDERLDVAIINSGLLTVVPESFHHNGWFQDDYGPLVYQNVSGNFSVVVHLRVSSATDVDVPPDLGYNAGGFVIRDATGTHENNENWVMYNMGGQGMNGVSYAREMKKTVNSVSNLFLTEQTSMEAYLLACRVEDNFYFYYWSDAVAGWRQETFYNNFDVDGTSTTTWRNSSTVTPEIISAGSGQAIPMYFNHPSMPEIVQVGVMAHAWSNNTNGSRGDYDFIRFATQSPQSQQDCTVAFEGIGNDIIFIDNFEG